jgi:O-antigen ligase
VTSRPHRSHTAQARAESHHLARLRSAIRLTPGVFYAPRAMGVGRFIWWRIATFLPGFAIITVVAFADSGYFRETWVWTTLALSSLIWIVLLLRDKIVLGRLDIAGPVALACFVGWVGLSAAWSPAPTDSLQEAERGLIYVAAYLAFVLLVERDRLREYLAGIAVAVTVVAAYGLGERLVGQEPASRDPIQGTRLIEPLGYANALGILAVLGLLLSAGLAAHAGSGKGRALWLAPICVLLPAFAWTESRGGSFALIAGLCVLAVAERTTITALLPGSRRLHSTVGLALAVVIVSALVVAAFRADRPLGPRVDYWTVAWDQWEENTWRGAGAGTFAQYWEREASPIVVQDAHSLYLETLAETRSGWARAARRRVGRSDPRRTECSRPAVGRRRRKCLHGVSRPCWSRLGLGDACRYARRAHVCGRALGCRPSESRRDHVWFWWTPCIGGHCTCDCRACARCEPGGLEGSLEKGIFDSALA